MSRPLLVLSTDFDGCLCPKDNRPELSKYRKLITDLYNHYSCGILGLDKVLISGSDRQSINLDAINAHNHDTDSSFKVLCDVAENMENVTLDRLLLEDIVKNQRVGTTFDQGLEGFEARKQNPAAAQPPFMDQHKILLIYTQLQHVAYTCPSQEIQFIFIDDNNEILRALINLFIKNKSLIPNHITLRLTCVRDLEHRHEHFNAEIKGTGMMNRNYARDVAKFIESEKETRGEMAFQGLDFRTNFINKFNPPENTTKPKSRRRGLFSCCFGKDGEDATEISPLLTYKNP